MDPTLDYVLSIADLFFTVLFIVELLIKALAYGGPRNYLKSSSNAFDAVIVAFSIPFLVEVALSGQLNGGSSSISAVRVFRLFRVLRVARLLHKLPSMKRLLDTVFYSATSIINLAFFIIFALTCCSILTTQLFARPYAVGDQDPNAMDSGFGLYADSDAPRYNFDTFFNSMLSLFIMMTGKEPHVIAVSQLKLYCNPCV